MTCTTCLWVTAMIVTMMTGKWTFLHALILRYHSDTTHGPHISVRRVWTGVLNCLKVTIGEIYSFPGWGC